jgi:citrate lyase subunit beta/citryl-CoA lyase
MSLEFRPRRSVLYMPGANSRALDKARSLPADTLIFDLEDAVAPAQKALAREQVLKALSAGGYGHREIVVRVNGLDTPWGSEDLSALAGAAVDAVLLPKVDDADSVVFCREHLTHAGAPDGLPLWVMAETPAGILNIREIARSDPGLAVIVMGTSDLAKALRLPPDPERQGLQAALGRCLLAARAEGLDILDGVFGDLNAPDAFLASCRQGKALGFDGKTLIHPRQLEGANEVFGVSGREFDQAQRVVSAWEEAAAAGQGIAVVDGQMIEQLHVDAARRLVALHAAIAAMGN